jgi:hypothetical protein
MTHLHSYNALLDDLDRAGRGDKKGGASLRHIAPQGYHTLSRQHSTSNAPAWGHPGCLNVVVIDPKVKSGNLWHDAKPKDAELKVGYVRPEALYGNHKDSGELLALNGDLNPHHPVLSRGIKNRKNKGFSTTRCQKVRGKMPSKIAVFYPFCSKPYPLKHGPPFRTPLDQIQTKKAKFNIDIKTL